LSSNSKTGLANWGNAFDGDRIDPGSGRPDAAPRDHAFDRGLGSFELDLDRPVGTIARKAGDVLTARLVTAAVAEPNALHQTAHDHPDANYQT
jgi:hypothetical protein